jgi:hypothetical protein
MKEKYCMPEADERLNIRIEANNWPQVADAYWTWMINGG